MFHKYLPSQIPTLIAPYCNLANIFWGRIEYELIYSALSKLFQFIFDETEKDICIIIWRITETKIANQNYQIIEKHFYFFKLLQTFIKQPGSPLCFYLSDWPAMTYNSQLNANQLLCSRTIIIVTAYQ